MRTYFKILLITVGIQILGFLICYLLDFIVESQESSTILPLYVGALFMLISMVLGVILPIRWYSNISKKIITIFLLPTNYTIPLCIVFVIKFIGNIGDILNNLPDNFG